VLGLDANVARALREARQSGLNASNTTPALNSPIPMPHYTIHHCEFSVCRCNASVAPGWSVEELSLLKLCLMKCGIGQWSKILQLGLLPGKQVTQLYAATQRMLGIQSLAAYTGQKLDVDAISAANARREGVRKAGLLTWQGSAFCFNLL
jgi:hypothetical protein